MATAFIVGEQVETSAELVALAKGAVLDTTLLVIGDVDEAMTRLGADKVISLKGASPRREAYAQAIADVVGQVGDALVLLPSTAAGRELGAYVAGLLEWPMVSDVSELVVTDGAVKVQRDAFGGAVVDSCEATLPCVATVLPSVCEPCAPSGASIVEEREVACDERVSRVSVSVVQKGSDDVASADRVVCVGMGIDGEDDLAMAQRLADTIGGALGCSRDIAEGRKLLPKERYIGITGASVSGSLYLSLGVSGQLQHVYGIRGAKVVAAVDLNKDAPIFRSADYGIVGDLHEIVPKMMALLEG